MTAIQIVVLALIQGVTEFLPVSSSAHLVLVGQFVEGWKDQGLAFDAAVHVGTLAAVMLYFRHDLAAMLKGALNRRADPVGRRLLLAVILATIPALIVGTLASGLIEAWTRNPILIAWTTILFGLLLGLADLFGRNADPVGAVGLRSALLIGLAQVLALIPGTSRSGITITAGLALGLSREAAARFSFLMSIPIIAAAGAWGFLSALTRGGTFELGQFAAGALIAGVFAWLTIAAFMVWLRRFGMAPFVLYRLLLGAFLLYWFAIR